MKDNLGTRYMVHYVYINILILHSLLLLHRNHLATDVMKYNAFELSDIVNPKRYFKFV